MTSKLQDLAARLGTAPGRLNYLVHCDVQREIAYFECPKVACTTIKKHMQDRVAGRAIHYADPGKVHDRAGSPLKRLSDLPPNDAEAAVFGSWTRFAFVRNPYTRVLSAYLDKIVQNGFERERHLPRLGYSAADRISFRQFLEAVERQTEAERDIHYVTEASLLCADAVSFAWVGSFETFAADFAELKALLYDTEDGAAEDHAFGTHHATGATERIARFYGDAELALAERIYAADFDIFGYSRGLANVTERPKRLDRSVPVSLARRLGLDRGVESSPTALPDAIRRAIERRDTSELAAGTYLARLPQETSSGGELTLLGIVWLLQAGAVEDALEVARQGRSAWPGHAGFANKTGHALMRLGRWLEADMVWMEVRAEHPGNILGFIGGARTALHTDQPTQAVELLMQAASFETVPAWAWNGLSRTAVEILTHLDDATFRHAHARIVATLFRCAATTEGEARQASLAALLRDAPAIASSRRASLETAVSHAVLNAATGIVSLAT